MSVDTSWRVVTFALLLFAIVLAKDGNFTVVLLAAIAAILITILRRLNDLQTALEWMIDQERKRS